MEGATQTPPPADPTAAERSPELCSPLEGFTLEALQAAVNNPYFPPGPGDDRPHHGVDFAVTGPYGIAQPGHPVQAVLPGHVSMALAGRFPYGNALLVETPLEQVPASFALPTLAPTVQPLAALTCPTAGPPAWDFTNRSLYLLYAHLQDPPTLEPGDALGCGQRLGSVGASGNALNPHLHLEARLGPGGARFESLAHYDSSASPLEMSNYCAWRVSGAFQMLDPLSLLAGLP